MNALKILQRVCKSHDVPQSGWVPWGGDYVAGTDYWRRYDGQKLTHSAVVHTDHTVEIYQLTARANGTYELRSVTGGCCA